MKEVFLNFTFFACLFSGLSVVFSTLVIVNFISESSKKYRERYTKETAVEYEDVLMQMPPDRIFDLSLALSALAAFLAIAIVSLTGTPSPGKICFIAIAAVAVAFPAPRLYLKQLKKKRLEKFNEQLEDALLSISGSLKAGFSINQALDVVAAENRRPISFEFSLLTQELRLGVSFEEALRKMTQRVGSQDFELVSMAIITARQTGGELTGVLERLAGVIRERMRITQKLQALTAQGRLQAYLIGIMPFALLLAMTYLSPDLMNSFFDTIIGYLLVMLVIVLDITGFLVIRKITTIDI